MPLEPSSLEPSSRTGGGIALDWHGNGPDTLLLDGLDKIAQAMLNILYSTFLLSIAFTGEGVMEGLVTFQRERPIFLGCHFTSAHRGPAIEVHRQERTARSCRVMPLPIAPPVFALWQGISLQRPGQDWGGG
jgi:hypothetical protein